MTHPMWHDDAASRGLGMVLEHAAPGAARLSMRVTPAMLNGLGTCHGGFIFALADSAFAFACNAPNATPSVAAPSVAAHCTISYLAPVHAGETLVASAEQRYQQGRGGITDVRVTSAGTTIAEFRGHSRTIAHTKTSPKRYVMVGLDPTTHGVPKARALSLTHRSADNKVHADATRLKPKATPRHNGPNAP